MDASHPELEIQIIGMNERGHEIGNNSITTDRDLPWLQDLDSDGDGQSDAWLNTWDYEYRDVVIVDVNGHPVDVYNLTTHDLGDEEKRETMKQMLISAAESTTSEPWTNPSDPLDVDGNSVISPFDALAVINVLNSIGSHELGQRGADDYFLDVSNDGFVSPFDALMILNRLNETNSVTNAAVPATRTIGASTDSAKTTAGSPQSTTPITANLAAAIDAAFTEADDLDERSSRQAAQQTAI